MGDLGTLRQTVSSLDGPLFAVLDGARFENLTDTLVRAGLRHRCLYLDRGDNNPERLVTAPHMVGPLDGGTMATVMDLLDEGGSAAGVFWACAAGADTLFRHLRRINMVWIPKGEALGRDGRAHERRHGTDHPSEELVLFRHADANVMAQVAPAISPEQFNALLGPARALYFCPGVAWNERRALLVAERRDGHDAASLPLHLNFEGFDAIRSRRADVVHSKIATYLKTYAPDQALRRDDENLRRFVRESVDDGRRRGLVSEAALGRWAYLRIMTDGRISRDANVTAYLGQAGPQTADTKVSLLLKSVVIAAKRQEDRA